MGGGVQVSQDWSGLTICPLYLTKTETTMVDIYFTLASIFYVNWDFPSAFQIGKNGMVQSVVDPNSIPHNPVPHPAEVVENCSLDPFVIEPLAIALFASMMAFLILFVFRWSKKEG
ncbi:unnamed protein product [Cochlearia groenlandica]